MDFRVVSTDEVESIRKENPSASVFYVNRLHDLKPPAETVRMFEDIRRRYGTKPNAYKFACEGSHYDARYRLKVSHSTKSMALVKDMIRKAKAGPVYLVKEKDRPDIDILVDFCNRYAGAGVI